MKLNTDDTFEEQYTNSMHKESNSLLNCMHCSRLFYMDSKIARDRLDHNIPLLCARCRKEKHDKSRRKITPSITQSKI